MEETEPATFSNASSYQSLFYEISVDPMQGEGVNDYFGFAESDTLVLEVPAALLWEQKQSAFLAAACELRLWLFTEKQCPLSQLMLDKWSFLTILIIDKHVLSTGLRTQYLPKYWFSTLATKYVFKTEQHIILNELSDFRKSVASGDEVLSAAVTRNSSELMHSLIVTDLPDLEIHTPGDGHVGCDAVLCQLNLVLEEASASEMAEKFPDCFEMECVKCFEMECVKSIRAPVRCKLKFSACRPRKKIRRAQENLGARAAAAQSSMGLGAGQSNV